MLETFCIQLRQPFSKTVFTKNNIVIFIKDTNVHVTVIEMDKTSYQCEGLHYR